jgi:hypothetical protein
VALYSLFYEAPGVNGTSTEKATGADEVLLTHLGKVPRMTGLLTFTASTKTYSS